MDRIDRAYAEARDAMSLSIQELLEAYSPQDKKSIAYDIIVEAAMSEARMNGDGDARQLVYDLLLRIAALHDRYCEATAPVSDEVLN